MSESFRVRIASRAWEFDAAAEDTVLISAARAGICLPSSCRNGTCRTCMCRLKSGRVAYRIEWPGLSMEEKRDGYILPCAAYPQSDLLIDEVAAARAEAAPQGEF